MINVGDFWMIIDNFELLLVNPAHFKQVLGEVRGSELWA